MMKKEPQPGALQLKPATSVPTPLVEQLADFIRAGITDEWSALVFLLEIGARGEKLPGDAATLVACNSGQIADAFRDCRRITLSPRKIAGKIPEVYNAAITGQSETVNPHHPCRAGCDAADLRPYGYGRIGFTRRRTDSI